MRWLRNAIRYIADELDFTADYRAYRRQRKLKALDKAEPIILTDPELGEFRLERYIGWYRQARRVAGRDIDIMLHLDFDDTEAGPQLETARAFLANAQAWHDRIKAYAVADLFETARDWVEAADGELTESDFAARLTLKSLGFYGEGGFEAWFDNDEIFGEHDVEVSGTLEEGPTNAGI